MKQTLLDIAEVIDAYRVFPRIVLAGYGYLAWNMHQWVTHLPDISASQSAYATAIVGLCVPLAGWYFHTGRQWGKKND